MPTPIENAYFAGFFDGEGCIDIRYSSGRYERFHLRVQVVQKVPDVLYEMKRLYGGSVAPRKGGTHRWVVSTATAAAFLENVMPYLRVKALEADIGLRFQSTVSGTRLFKGKGNGKGFAFVTDAVREQRYNLMIEMRQARHDKGLYARDRASVPPTRTLQAVSSAA